MLYANTDEGSSAIWVLDGNGVVVDNISYSIGERAPILAQINEHFGTSFTGWSDNEIGLRVGDSLPNWNAYEKIAMSSRKIAYNIQSTSPKFIFGTIINNILHLEVDTSEASWLAANDGNISVNRGPGIQAKTWIMHEFSSIGITITDVVGNIVQYEVGQIVPDWSEYEKLNV